MSETVESALVAADWWAGLNATQPDHSTTEAFGVLAAEIRRLRAENETLRHELERFTTHA